MRSGNFIRLMRDSYATEGVAYVGVGRLTALIMALYETYDNFTVNYTVQNNISNLLQKQWSQ